MLFRSPFTPSRLNAGPLGGRVVTACLAGAALAIGMGRGWIFGVLGCAVGSLAGAFSGYHTRQMLVRRMKLADWIVAVIEDIVTITLVLLALALLF